MTNDELEKIRARAEAATAGPWDGESTTITDWRDFSFTMEWMANGDYPNEPADRAFIAHARTDIPALLDEVERLRGDAHIQRNFWQMEDALARAEAHAERLASALEFITDERVDRENITTAQLEGLRQALSDYTQRTET